MRPSPSNLRVLFAFARASLQRRRASITMATNGRLPLAHPAKTASCPAIAVNPSGLAPPSGLFPQKMPHPLQQVPRDHARACIAHDGAYTLAHPRRITVVSTLLAACFRAHLAASLSPLHGVLVKLLAGRTQLLAAKRRLRARGSTMDACAEMHTIWDMTPFLALATARFPRCILPRLPLSLHVAHVVLSRQASIPSLEKGADGKKDRKPR